MSLGRERLTTLSGETGLHAPTVRRKVASWERGGTHPSTLFKLSALNFNSVSAC